MEAKKILEAILEDKLVSVCNLAHLLVTSDLIFNSFITMEFRRKPICFSNGMNPSI